MFVDVDGSCFALKVVLAHQTRLVFVVAVVVAGSIRDAFGGVLVGILTLVWSALTIAAIEPVELDAPRSTSETTKRDEILHRQLLVGGWVGGCRCAGRFGCGSIVDGGGDACCALWFGALLEERC